MPKHDTSTADSNVLRVAGVRFILPDTSPASGIWPAPFGEFLGENGDTEIVCRVRSDGPDEALAAAAPDLESPWQFRVEDGCFELTRRSSDGVALWRLRAPLGFEQAVVSWHPQRFHAVCGDYLSSWATSLGRSLLAFCLRARGGLVLHGSAATLDGQGILCAGVSGAGKSTMARLLHAAGADVLTDERPVVRQWPPPAGDRNPSAPAAFRVYGTPWPSSAGFARNAWAPLRRIYFLEHGTADGLTPLTPREAFNRLIHVATIPWQDAALFDPCLATVETLLQSVPCAVLSFRPTPDVVDVIRKDLVGQHESNF